jgi:predicted TIM-barrel fold metal-dependent hydrolase
VTEYPDYPIIDVHIHIQPWWQMLPEVQATMARGRAQYDELLAMMREPRAFLNLMDRAGVERAGLINYVAPDLMGFDDSCCEFAIDYARHAPDRLIPFGSVNPRLRKDCGARLRELIDSGLGGVKVHPPHQLVQVNDYRNQLPHQAEIYAECQKAGLPVMIHTGTSIFPGARNTFAPCMPVDDLAVDFPELDIIMAHGGRPLYMDEAFFLVRRHAHVYMDISGIPPARLPDYFPRLEEISDKVLWGTDWPGPGVPDLAGNVKQFWALPLSEPTRKKILHDNAQRLFRPR